MCYCRVYTYHNYGCTIRVEISQLVVTKDSDYMVTMSLLPILIQMGEGEGKCPETTKNLCALWPGFHQHCQYELIGVNFQYSTIVYIENDWILKFTNEKFIVKSLFEKTLTQNFVVSFTVYVHEHYIQGGTVSHISTLATT